MSTILALVALVTPIAILFLRKSIPLLSFQIFGSLALAGTLLAITDRIQGLIQVEIAELLIIISFLAVFTILLMSSKTQTSNWKYEDLPLVIISISVALVLAFSRSQASSVVDGFFSGAGRLAVAEDNAKWVNFSSNVAQSNLLNLNDGTSGGLAALILIASAFVSHFSITIVGGLNLPGITIQSVLLSHNLLLVLAPLALTPIVFSIWNDSNKTESKLSKFTNSWGAGIAGLFSVFAVAAPMAFGHLSFEFILVTLIFWASYVVHNKVNSQHLVLVTFIGSSVALVWLPLPNFSIVVALTGVAIWAVFSRPKLNIRWYLEGLLLAANALLVIWLSAPMMQYLANTTTPQSPSPSSSSTSSIDLVVAEGGAMAAGKFEYFLLAICLMALIFAIVKTPKPKRPLQSLSAYPVVFLLGYACAVAGYDYIVASQGWPHYGTRKLVFGFVAVSIAVLIPVVVSSMQQLSGKRSWLTPVALVLITGIIFASGSFRRSSFLFNSGVWSSFDSRIPTAGVGDKTWLDLANPENSPETLTNYPILCVETDKKGIIVGVTDQYFCSRFLIAMHGLEASGNIMLIPILTSPVSDETVINIQELANKIGQSPILEIDKAGTIKKQISFDQYIELIKFSNEQKIN